jgi:hypothetical protein
MKKYHHVLSTLREIGIIKPKRIIEDQDQVSQFEHLVQENKKLPEGIFFELIQKTVWENGDYIQKPSHVFYTYEPLSEDELDVLIQVESLKRFDKIEKHLLFFKVTTIVCLILSVLYILWSLTFLVN